MSFLNKFQYHYHSKHVEDLINAKNYDNFFIYLQDLADKKKIFYDISLKYVAQAIRQSNKEVTNKKLVWINSFLEEDTNYIASFFEHYFKDDTSMQQEIVNYQTEIDNILQKDETIDFNVLINHSYFFQWMLISQSKHSFKFIKNQLPFFSTDEDLNFTKSNLSQSYIHLINNPYNVYQIIKNKNNNDQEVSRNIFLNLDKKALSEKIGKTNFSISKKGWHTHSQSWLDPNVINSLRGKTVSIKELFENTYETLSSIVMHLIQSGVNVDLNYDLIENFIKDNPTPHYGRSEDLSQKEVKFIDKYVSEIMASYDF